MSEDTVVISASVPAWIAEELDNHPDVDNKSALIRRLLEDWLKAGEDTEVAAYQRQIESKKEQKREHKNKAESLDRDIQRLERMVEKAQRQESLRLHEELEQYATIPADATHPEIKRIADDADLSPEVVAEEHAELHGKELKDNESNDRRGFQ